MTASAHTSTFVVNNERDRLVALFVDLVAERGFAQVSLDGLAARAGVGVESVRRDFASEEACALAACDISTQQCFTAAAQAFVSTPGDCPLAARAALDAMLRYMAGAPSFVHLVVVEYPRLGELARSHRSRHLDLFAEFLGPGFAAAGEMPPQPELLSLLIAGGIYEVLSKHYLEGRLEQLPEALPAVTFFTVAPFFGLEEARRVASLPVSAQP